MFFVRVKEKFKDKNTKKIYDLNDLLGVDSKRYNEIKKYVTKKLSPEEKIKAENDNNIIIDINKVKGEENKDEYI